MALPILRETSMTTLHIEHGEPDPETPSTSSPATSSRAVLAEVIHR